MGQRNDPPFINTKELEVGDLIEFDGSKEGTGVYETDFIAKKFPLSVTTARGKFIGAARIVRRIPPGAPEHRALSSPSPSKPVAFVEPTKKPWFIRDEKPEKENETSKPYISFPF